MKIEYLEDDEGNLTKVLVSSERFETLHLSREGKEPTMFCLVLTDEMEEAIKPTNEG